VDTSATLPQAASRRSVLIPKLRAAWTALQEHMTSQKFADVRAHTRARFSSCCFWLEGGHVSPLTPLLSPLTSHLWWCPCLCMLLRGGSCVALRLRLRLRCGGCTEWRSHE